MAKVRLTGSVNVEFEVKFGLNEDLVINVQAIEFEVDNKQYKVLVGEGDISNIPTKTLEFIGSRIEYFLRKEKDLIAVDGFGNLFRYGYLSPLNDDKFYKALFKTELGKVMLKACDKRDIASLEEVLNRNLWFVSASGMREFAGWKKVKAKATKKDVDFETAAKVKELV